MFGTLYLCATPIGNLEDITLRVLNTLKSVDLIACEDTRVSAKLLSHYDIHVKTTSYYEHNKKQKGQKILDELMSGKNVALVSDAGMPGISDPGEDLVSLCIEEGIPYTILPGASAGISALVLSGISGRRYVFEGFLPKPKKERQDVLKSLETESRTIILYESPHHLKETLKELENVLGERQISIVRELTKKFEEVERYSLKEAVLEYEKKEPRGEYVLVIEGLSQEEKEQEETDKWRKIPLEEHMSIYIDKGMDKKDAMKAVAKDRKISKRDVYNELVKEREERC